jgi:hypothetical protein
MKRIDFINEPKKVVRTEKRTQAEAGCDFIIIDKALRLMHPEMGLYKAAALPLSGIEVVLNLRAEMGFLKKPLPKPEKFYDLSYYQKATQ